MRKTMIVAALAVAGCVTTIEKSYEAAQVYGPPMGEERGVVLHLHGCSGLRMESHIWDFAKLFMDAGWVVVSPDSFADSRPPSGCPAVTGRTTQPLVSRQVKQLIDDVRRQQAKYALERVRADFPGLPVVVWGHSEGANAANRLDDKVAGIVTTGYACGWRTTTVTSIREDVPLLAIMGTDDPYLDWVIRGSGYGNLHSLCEYVFQSPAWRYVIVEGMRHQPVVRRREVREAVASFLERLGF